MPKSPSGSHPPRRPRARAGVPSNGAASPAVENLVRSPDARDERVAAEPMASDRPSAAEPASGESAAAGMVIELPARPRKAVRRRKYKPPADPRFRIFIIDSGWNSVARRVLRHNFALIRRLHKEDLIYLLSRKRSAEFIRRHRSLIGRDPIIAVHDLTAMGRRGTAGFHGFHLHLGILRAPRQILVALQTFAHFVGTHRHSANLEADIRTGLRREGMLGSVEILLHKVPRALGV
jgi:hypothetical protein